MRHVRAVAPSHAGFVTGLSRPSMHPALSAPVRLTARRSRVVALGVVALASAAIGCNNKNELVSIDIPRMTPNPAPLGTKAAVSVIVFNRIGCNLASIKVTYGVTVVSTKQVDVGQAYLDSITVTGTGPVVAEARCGEAINTQSAILTAN